MGKKAFSQLERIDNNQDMTAEAEGTFSLQFQHSLLLALKEQELLSEAAYQYAAEKLQEHAKIRTQKPTSKGGNIPSSM